MCLGGWLEMWKKNIYNSYESVENQGMYKDLLLIPGERGFLNLLQVMLEMIYGTLMRRGYFGKHFPTMGSG